MSDGDVPGLWKRGVEEVVLTPTQMAQDLCKRLEKGSRRWLALGEGRARYPEAWEQLPSKRELAQVSGLSSASVQGRYVALLAWEAFQAGLLTEGIQVRPRYLRASDAEVKLKARLSR